MLDLTEAQRRFEVIARAWYVERAATGERPTTLLSQVGRRIYFLSKDDIARIRRNAEDWVDRRSRMLLMEPDALAFSPGKPQRYAAN